jgi:hypothetical protein
MDLKNRNEGLKKKGGVETISWRASGTLTPPLEPPSPSPSAQRKNDRKKREKVDRTDYRALHSTKAYGCTHVRKTPYGEMARSVKLRTSSSDHSCSCPINNAVLKFRTPSRVLGIREFRIPDGHEILASGKTTQKRKVTTPTRTPRSS